MNKTDHSNHQKLRLRNFTAFSDTQFDFVPGINALIGENGVGKTHVLKALYAWQFSQLEQRRAPQPWREVFQLDSENSLVRQNAPEAMASLSGRFGEIDWNQDLRLLDPREFDSQSITHTPIKSQPIFIPSVDMMGHTRGFLSTYDHYNIDFDLTHREIVSLLLSPELREGTRLENVSQPLQQILGGSLELEGERFYLNTRQGRFPMPAVAEGLRKVATLWRLMVCGWLTPGSVLFWDEPEVNLNPCIMDEVVGVLLDLARNGVQIFLATHSYLILREIEVQAGKADCFRFFALEKLEGGVKVHESSTYLGLMPNLIEEQYSNLYDRNIQKRIVESGHAQ